MTGLRIALVHTDDETLRVEVNGHEAITATHESVGWAGIEAIEKVVREIADAAGVEVEDRD